MMFRLIHEIRLLEIVLVLQGILLILFASAMALFAYLIVRKELTAPSVYEVPEHDPPIEVGDEFTGDGHKC